MLKRLAKWYLGQTNLAQPAPRKSLPLDAFSTHRANGMGEQNAGTEKISEVFRKAASLIPTRAQIKDVDGNLVAFDTVDDGTDMLKAQYRFSAGLEQIPDALLSWFASQTFIGVQLAAVFSQHWLVDKACSMPARDALRHGFEVTFAGVDDENKQREISDFLGKANKRFKLSWQLQEYLRMGRILGTRIAIFRVKPPEGVDEDEYYKNPFNIDAVTPGSYQGISQVDQNWCFPVLDSAVMTDPANPDFYDPTWWRIGARLYHKSHLAIFRNAEVPDLLKPLYNYGGVSISQRLFERVYAAERTANEAPLLAMTKRSMVWKTDMTDMVAAPEATQQMLEYWVRYRDNYGIKLANDTDDVMQIETSLADLDAVIMTQYQIVAAIAGVPVTKLMGTTPKGFNATGENETRSYHEELETLQTNDLQPFLERHLMLLSKSELEPEFNLSYDDMDPTVKWNSVDSPTAKERAEINVLKADYATKLSSIGAIDGIDERNRISKDKQSGYTDLPEIDEGDLEEPDETGGSLNDRDPVTNKTENEENEEAKKA